MSDAPMTSYAKLENEDPLTVHLARVLLLWLHLPKSDSVEALRFGLGQGAAAAYCRAIKYVLVGEDGQVYRLADAPMWR